LPYNSRKRYTAVTFLHHESRETNIYDSGEIGDNHGDEPEEPIAVASSKLSQEPLLMEVSCVRP